MTDSQWSLLIGLGVVIVMRVLDSMLPKGYMLKWVNKYFVKVDDDDDDPKKDELTP